MRRLAGVAALAMLSGCVTMRVGVGASHRGDARERPVTPEFELGLIVPLSERWSAEAISVVHAPTGTGGNPILGVEVNHVLGRAMTPVAAGDSGTSPIAMPVHRLGARLEVGRDHLGRYLGGAFVLRRLGDVLLLPLGSSLSLVVSGGYYDGPVRGAAAGVRVLVGIW